MTIRTGIGGWVYPDWRKGTFYPEGLAQKRELEWASRQLGAIEINGTNDAALLPASNPSQSVEASYRLPALS